MEINIWCGTSLVEGIYDAKQNRWHVKLQKLDGKTVELNPRHLVFATGLSGIPNLPDLPGKADYEGIFVHSHGYKSGHDFIGRHTVVLGTGNSGHDIAQDLHASGALVTMIQRNPTTVQSLDQANRYFDSYSDQVPTEESDLQGLATSHDLFLKFLENMTEEMRKVDQPVLEGLEKKGFRVDAPHKTGYLTKYLSGRAGGYYLNVGCSDLIASGEIKVRQFSDVDSLVGQGFRMKDGSIVPAELIVSATGYKGQQETVRKILGDEIADRVGTIWGFDEKGDQLNVWQRTPQPGLWFTAGGFPHSRIYTRYLALLIKASESGLISS